MSDLHALSELNAGRPLKKRRTGTLRKVQSSSIALMVSGYVYILELECGHRAYRTNTKQPAPKTARCERCPQ